jgi:ABC-type antimicrobial peptide transport system permease subunit
MTGFRVSTQLVAGWMSDVPQRCLASAALVCIEVAVILSMVGMQHGLKSSVSNAKLLSTFYASSLLLFVSLVGFVFLAIDRYFCALEKSQELGILKVFGASEGYLLLLLFAEAMAICAPGSLAGMGFTFFVRWGARLAFPRLLQADVVYLWWPIGFGIVVFGSILGTTIGARKAIRDGVTQALSYEP